MKVEAGVSVWVNVTYFKKHILPDPLAQPGSIAFRIDGCRLDETGQIMCPTLRAWLNEHAPSWWVAIGDEPIIGFTAPRHAIQFWDRFPDSTVEEIQRTPWPTGRVLEALGIRRKVCDARYCFSS